METKTIKIDEEMAWAICHNLEITFGEGADCFYEANRQLIQAVHHAYPKVVETYTWLEGYWKESKSIEECGG